MRREIAARELAARLAAGEPTYLVDVRQAWEHALVAIAGSVRVPLGELPHRRDELDPPAQALDVLASNQANLGTERPTVKQLIEAVDQKLHSNPALLAPCPRCLALVVGETGHEQLARPGSVVVRHAQDLPARPWALLCMDCKQKR
jgi:rhodanese-related sulfurtransferase